MASVATPFDVVQSCCSMVVCQMTVHTCHTHVHKHLDTHVYTHVYTCVYTHRCLVQVGCGTAVCQTPMPVPSEDTEDTPVELLRGTSERRASSDAKTETKEPSKLETTTPTPSKGRVDGMVKAEATPLPAALRLVVLEPNSSKTNSDSTPTGNNWWCSHSGIYLPFGSINTLICRRPYVDKLPLFLLCVIFCDVLYQALLR